MIKANDMENTWTAENAVREKSALQRPSSKLLEARITAYTVILAAIIVNILWWAGSQSVEWESNSNITQENILHQPAIEIFHRTSIHP